MHTRATSLLLNVAHALDHMFLLIFATAVSTIAAEFGLARWEDLMPYGAAAFLMFGLGSLPAGKLGDSWGRRAIAWCVCRPARGSAGSGTGPWWEGGPGTGFL